MSYLDDIPEHRVREALIAELTAAILAETRGTRVKMDRPHESGGGKRIGRTQANP